MGRKLQHIDPYFAVGLAAAVVLGGIVGWTRMRSTVPHLKDFPTAVASAYDSMTLTRTIGVATAPVSVQEVTDLECPACAQAHKTLWPIMAPLIRNGMVRYSIYDILAHSHSANATVAAECVRSLGDAAYWQYRTIVFATQSTWSTAFSPNAVLSAMASRVGGDSVTVAQCMTRTGPRLLAQFSKANKVTFDAGVRFTPLYAVNNRVVPWDSVGSLVTEAIRTRH